MNSMNAEMTTYMVTRPDNQVYAEGLLDIRQAFYEAKDAVSHGLPEATVWIKVGVVKRTRVESECAPMLQVPDGLDEWLKQETKEIR